MIKSVMNKAKTKLNAMRRDTENRKRIKDAQRRIDKKV